MTLLALYDHRSSSGAQQAGTSPPLPELLTSDAALISKELGSRGIRFERWPAQAALPTDADQAAILQAYGNDIARVQQHGGYGTVDAIRVMPEHPDRAALRQKFLAEHTHSEDEVRFFVEGRGLFCLHLGDEVIQLLCEQNDWIAVPAGTRHWFDMGPEPHFCALRFFNNTEGWVADFTGDPIAQSYPLLDQLTAPRLSRP
ncbi:MAG: acireductone dioxygenase [Cyanobacteriota bacterium]|nr:acireductone dioxygenase [Cyanobacteriota bacterium]